MNPTPVVPETLEWVRAHAEERRATPRDSARRFHVARRPHLDRPARS